MMLRLQAMSLPWAGSQYNVRSHLRGQLAADERRQLAELLLQGALVPVVGDDPIKRHAGVQTAL